MKPVYFPCFLAVHFTDRRVNVRQHIDGGIPQNGPSGEDLLAFQARRQGLIENPPDLRMLLLEGFYQFTNNHKLVPRHEKNEVTAITEFKMMQIINSIRWYDGQFFFGAIASPLCLTGLFGLYYSCRNIASLGYPSG